MAKPRDKDEERAMDLDHLEPAMRERAHDLGFRKRASINKILRGIEHEKLTSRISLGFEVFMGLATLGSFVGRALAGEDHKGQLLLVGLFAFAWAIGAWAYKKRADHRHRDLEQLLAIVKEKLGK